MKRILGLALLLFALLMTGAAPQHGGHGGPGFCISGWVLSSHSSLPAGNGCYYIEDEYTCADTNQTLLCHHLECPPSQGGNTSEVCQPE